MERKSFLKVFISAMMILVMIVSSVSFEGIQSEAKASYNTNMANYLNYYKAGNYKMAKKYAKKLKLKKDTSIKKLTKKQKKAYLKIVSKYSADLSNYKQKDGYLDGYYLADMNGDKKAELLVKHGTCEADYRTEIYTFKNGKAKKIATTSAGHLSYVAYPGHGVVTVWGHMGYCSVGVMKVKKGKVVSQNYGSQSNVYEYIIPENFLDNHISYDADYKRLVDYSPLQ